jgi:uncharacterized protein YdbL (DUF1318 family)
MFAHFYGSKAKGFILIINNSASIRGDLLKQISVSGKREARQIANQLNATCWNF